MYFALIRIPDFKRQGFTIGLIGIYVHKKHVLVISRDIFQISYTSDFTVVDCSNHVIRICGNDAIYVQNTDHTHTIFKCRWIDSPVRCFIKDTQVDIKLLLKPKVRT